LTASVEDVADCWAAHSGAAIRSQGRSALALDDNVVFITGAARLRLCPKLYSTRAREGPIDEFAGIQIRIRRGHRMEKLARRIGLNQVNRDRFPGSQRIAIQQPDHINITSVLRELRRVPGHTLTLFFGLRSQGYRLYLRLRHSISPFVNSLHCLD
jgi:hypothetical protein